MKKQCLINNNEDQLYMDQTREDLIGNNKFMNAVLESLDNGLIALDSRGVISSVNGSAAKLLGMSPIDLTGLKIGSTPLSGAVQFIDGQLSPGRNIATLHTKNGPRRCLVTAKPIKDDTWPWTGSVITLSEAPPAVLPKTGGQGWEARYTFDDIMGESPAILDVKAKAQMAAASSSTILIWGESGVGKELFAQAIHNASPRRQAPFVSINCAALPKELIQSELFGYVEGAFTGAHKGGRRGKIELAHGGTLFLDEIADMPLELQANLLRVLEEKSFLPLGGDKMVKVDLRVIAATQRRLEQDVLAGRFREDLYYRLNVVALHILPLRERVGDLGLLIPHYLKKLAEKTGRPVPKPDPSLPLMLASHRWPGNIRELINALEQAVNFMNGNVLLYRHLPAYLKVLSPSGPAEDQGIVPLSVVEKKAIEHALGCCQGNVSQVARALGIGRNTLYYKMKKYGIVAGLGKNRPRGLHP